MQNSGTSSFGYRASLDGKMHYNYTIQYIEGAYYVGFDFEATGQNPNQQVAADGYYSDWIVKISPAVYTNAYRIIAEDLGDSDDFDFNDVVFDVATNGGATIITLQAAGGTLPLYIEVGGDSREVHGLFGVSNTTMVNTGAGATKAPVMYRVDGTGAVNVKVEGQNAEVYTLKAEIGKAPQKIRVETRYEWTAERQDINDKYPGLQIGWLILRLIGINRIYSILFKADDIMKGYITCLFMFRPLYIEIYYLCGVASSWYIIFSRK